MKTAIIGKKKKRGGPGEVTIGRRRRPRAWIEIKRRLGEGQGVFQELTEGKKERGRDHAGRAADAGTKGGDLRLCRTYPEKRGKKAFLLAHEKPPLFKKGEDVGLYPWRGRQSFGYRVRDEEEGKRKKQLWKTGRKEKGAELRGTGKKREKHTSLTRSLKNVNVARSALRLVMKIRTTQSERKEEEGGK